jgi:hypothetical protein
MPSLSILFTSILVGCESKSDTSSAIDTSESIEIDSSVSFEYACNFDENMCTMETTQPILEEEQFTLYLDSNGQLTEDACMLLCSTEVGVMTDYLCGCEYTGMDNDGMHPVTCEYASCAVEGRGHGDIQKNTVGKGPSFLAGYFSRAYHAEASSVAAFLQLRAELKSHGAPIELQNRCLSAAIEEVHHARMMNQLLQDSGGCSQPLSFGTLPKRSLYELALDNAVEGCVFESYSALKALYQARHATDERIVFVMKVLSKDELGHAQLSWDIHHYLMTKLSKTEQRAISNAQRKALQDVNHQAQLEFNLPQSSSLGFPPITVAESFAQKLKIA